MDMEPDLAESLYEKAIQQITSLRSAEILNKKDEWLTELDRIHREITQKISTLRLRRRRDSIIQSNEFPGANHHPKASRIPEWTDPLLQQRFQIQLAESIILPGRPIFSFNSCLFYLLISIGLHPLHPQYLQPP
jgi:hypothetical protein